jgi:predicted dehydrogenase
MNDGVMNVASGADPLGVGIVGCGNIATRMHVPAWLEMPDLVRIVAVADPDPAARARARDLTGLDTTAVHESTDELLARHDVRIVDVCTPQAFRRDLLVRAANAGKHILCEKPLATTPADAHDAVEAADTNGVLLGVVHNYLTTPEVVAALDVIASGVIGSVRSVVVNMLGIAYEPGAAGDWRRDPALSGGGVLADLIHGVYLAEAFAGEPIRRVSASVASSSPEAPVEDLAACRFETDHCIAMFNVGWGYGPGGYHVTGTNGRIDVRFEEGATPPWANLEHVRVTTPEGTREIMGPATDRRIGLGDFPSHGRAFRRLARSFAEAAHGRGRPVATGADGLRALEATIGAYVSAATGRTVEVPLDRASAPFRRGAMGVPECSSASWSPFAGSRLFRPLVDREPAS